MSEAELREKIADTMGRIMATHVSGNNMPHMSGDDRDRLPPHKRLRFDEACGHAADTILALVHSAIQAARVEALREAKDVARLCLDMAVAAAGERAMGARQGARSVHEAIAALIEKEGAP